VRGSHNVNTRYLVGAAVLGLLLSQLGHTLAFLTQFGFHGLTLESTGVHAYYPAIGSISAAAVGLAGLVVLLIVGLARLLRGRSSELVKGSRTPFLQLLAVLITVQLTVYLAQEVTEDIVSGDGVTVGSIVGILAWGTVGQGPLAILAAAALCWCSVRLSAALIALRSNPARRLAWPIPAPAVQSSVNPSPARHLMKACRQALAKRGPPEPPRLLISIR